MSEVKIKVKQANADVRVPLLTGGWVEGGAEVEVVDHPYYRIAIKDGDLQLVEDAAVAPKVEVVKLSKAKE
jgi:hypothetical protein